MNGAKKRVFPPIPMERINRRKLFLCIGQKESLEIQKLFFTYLKPNTLEGRKSVNLTCHLAWYTFPVELL